MIQYYFQWISMLIPFIIQPTNLQTSQHEALMIKFEVWAHLFTISPFPL